MPISGKPVAAVGAALGQCGGVWAQDEARNAVGIAGGAVVLAAVTMLTTQYAKSWPDVKVNAVAPSHTRAAVAAAAAEPAGRGRRARRTAGSGQDDLPAPHPAPPSQALVRVPSRPWVPPYESRQGRTRTGQRRAFLGSSASPNLTPGVRDGRSGLRRRRARGVRAGGSRRQGGDEAVTTENVVGLVVAVSLLGYLILALLFPERF